MAFDLPGPSDSALPDVAIPGVSYAATRKVTDSAQLAVGRIEQRVKATISNSLKLVADSLVSLAHRIAGPVTQVLNDAGAAVDGLEALARNALRGSLSSVAGQGVASGYLPDSFAGDGPSGAGATSDYTAGVSSQPDLPGGSDSADFGVPSGSAVPPPYPGHGIDTGMPPAPPEGPPAGGGPGGGAGCPPAGITQQALNAAAAAIARVLRAAGPQPGNEPVCEWVWWFDDACKLHATTYFDLGYQYPAQTVTTDQAWQSLAAAALAAGATASGLAGQLDPPSKESECQGKGPIKPIKPGPLDTVPITQSGKCDVQLTCPPPVINIPKCPELKIPDCVQVTLCDWDKLLDILCRFARECMKGGGCDLDNESSWAYKNCDGSFEQTMRGWLGDTGRVILDAEGADDMVGAAANLPLGLSGLDYFGSDPEGPPPP